MQCRSVLALTATATKATEADVAKVLSIQPEQVIRDSNVRDNLRLSVFACNGGMSSPCICSTLPSCTLAVFSLTLAACVYLFCVDDGHTAHVPVSVCSGFDLSPEGWQTAALQCGVVCCAALCCCAVLLT